MTVRLEITRVQTATATIAPAEELSLQAAVSFGLVQYFARSDRVILVLSQRAHAIVLPGDWVLELSEALIAIDRIREPSLRWTEDKDCETTLLWRNDRLEGVITHVATPGVGWQWQAVTANGNISRYDSIAEAKEALERWSTTDSQTL